MKKLLLLFFILLTTAGIAGAETVYTWKVGTTTNNKGNTVFENNAFSTTNKTADLGGLTWDLETTCEAFNKDNYSTTLESSKGRGWLFGSSSKPFGKSTFSTESLSNKKIKSVSVVTGTTGTNVTLEVKVGGVSYGGAKDISTNPPKEFTFTGDETGKIELIYNSTVQKAVCLFSITIVYDEAGPVDYIPSFQTLNLKVGDKVNPQPADAPEMAFMTNDKTVVTDTDNILEAVGEGSTTIDVMWAASDKWNEGETSFTVNVSKHEYTPEWGDITLSEGDDYQLVLGENHPELLAESDNEEVAMIDEYGFIIAGTAGTANITVIWGDDKWVDGSAEFTVTVTKPRRDVVLTWSAETANATLGSEFSAPTLSANIEDALAEVVLSSSNTEVAAIEDDNVVIKGAGTATITAAIANSTDFNDATASYTLTVVDPNAPQDVTFDFSTKDAYGMKSGADYIYTTVTCEAANGVKIEIIPTAESGNTFRHWSATGGYDLRIYDNSKLVVTAPAGFELAKISFEKGLSKDFSMNASAGTLNTREWTAKDTECIKEVVFTKADKNSTMSSITVSLKACPAEAPELALEGSKVIATPKSADHTIVWRVRPVEGSQSPVMRAVAATDWTSHNVGEVLEHEIQPNEAYYLDVKAMTSNGHESAVNTLLLQNGEVTGIEDVVTEAGEVEYFNLQGIRVVNPENGIFIRRQGGKTSKVAL